MWYEHGSDSEQLRSCEKKVKCTLVQALKLCTSRTAHRGSRGIALTFLDHGTRRGWGVSVTPRPLFTPGEKNRHPLYRRLGGPQGRSGQVRKISPPPGFDLRTVQPVASRYTDYATRPTIKEIAQHIFSLSAWNTLRFLLQNTKCYHRSPADHALNLPLEFITE